MKLKAKKSDFPMSRTIQLGYCQMAYLLGYLNPIAYTAGVYGWNADIYEYNGYYICTGYRPFGKIVPDYKMAQEFNEKANAIRKKEYKGDFSQQQSKRKRAIYSLLDQFIKEATKA